MAADKSYRRPQLPALPIGRVATLLVLMLAMFVWITTQVSATAFLSGTYKITEKTDLGTEIRLSVELNFRNSSDTPFTVSGVGLRSITVPGHMQNQATTVVVQPHSNSLLSLQFVMSKKDFSLWSIGPHQQFVVTLQSVGGKVVRANLPLRRTQG